MSSAETAENGLHPGVVGSLVSITVLSGNVSLTVTAKPGGEPPTAVLVIDVQRDFCSGGALAVPAGDAVVPVLNDVMRSAEDRRMPVYASRDWHPAASRHFVTGGGVWPVHCVAGSDGARFHPDLRLPAGAAVVDKGVEAHEDGFSAFDGRLDDGRTLAEGLRASGVSRLLVGGLATDYCVRHTVLDALRQGWSVTLLTDAVSAVDLEPDDGARALEEMRAAGAELIASADLDWS